MDGGTLYARFLLFLPSGALRASVDGVEVSNHSGGRTAASEGPMAFAALSGGVIDEGKTFEAAIDDLVIAGAPLSCD